MEYDEYVLYFLLVDCSNTHCNLCGLAAGTSELEPEASAHRDSRPRDRPLPNSARRTAAEREPQREAERVRVRVSACI